MSLLPIIECKEPIPCNPCEMACKFGAIQVGDPITNLPQLNPHKCKGCGICAAVCPGLAIFLVDLDYSEKEALVAFPFEFLPLPVKGQKVRVVDGEGQVIGEGQVQRVWQPLKDDPTRLVQVLVAKTIALDVRGMKILAKRE